MKKYTAYIIVVIIGVLFSVVLASAAPEHEGVEVTTGANETYSPNQPAENATIFGGNISSVNITQTNASLKWVGIVGQITGNRILGTNANTFYDWGTFAPVGGIFLANATSFSSGSVTATTDQIVARENSHLAMGTSRDNISNTFNGTNRYNVSIGATTITPGSTHALNTTGGWETAMVSSGTTIIYTSPILQDTNDFAGRPVDYQMMIPVNATSGQRTYHFFAVITN